MRKNATKIFACFLFVAVFVVVFVVQFPAWMVAKALSNPKIELLATQGTLWHGSTQIAWRQADGELVALPGEFTWELSPWQLFVGKIDLSVSHKMLPNRLLLTGEWYFHQLPTVRVADGEAMLPADWLVFLGAPFNTLQPEGGLQVQWRNLASAKNVTGKLIIKWLNASARFSPVRPLGDYQLSVDLVDKPQWRLQTMSGVLKLEGEGRVGRSSVIKATPDPAVFQKLRNMMNLLGPRRGNYYEIKAG